MAEQFGKYQIEAVIGQGAFGVVYRATDTSLNRPVALKVLHPVLMTDSHWVGRFRTEAQAMARLHHPHIAVIYEVGEATGRLFIAMQYVAGPDLGRGLKEDGPLSWAETLRAIQTVAGALDHAHAAGVLHRDLKPENILLGPEGPVLTDFGVARLVGESRASGTLSGGMVGTPNYIAPEIWRGQDSSAAVDLYALGCIVHEMLTGRLLYDGPSTAAIIHAHLQPPELPDEWPQDAPPGLNGVLQRALSQQPEARYETAGAFAAALAELGAEPVPPPLVVAQPQEPAGTPERDIDEVKPEPEGAQPQRAIPLWVWGVGGLLLLLLCILAGWGLFSLLGGGDDGGTPVVQATHTLPVVTVADLPSRTPLSPSDTPQPTSSPTDIIEPTAPNTLTPAPTGTATPDTDQPPATPVLGDTWERPADGMTMVYVPAGNFLMGSAAGDTEADDDEFPQHEVTLDGFWIDQTEVTNTMFADFLNEEGNQNEGLFTWFATWLDAGDEDILIQSNSGRFEPESGYEDHPVIEVSWYGAAAYCEWIGGRLPTEAEWEYAAAGPDANRYPWGDTFDGKLVNFCDTNCALSRADDAYDDGFARTAPVGSYPAGSSWVGALDLAGNVRELVQDWYDSDYYENAPESNPAGPANGSFKVMRGGSWYYDSRNARTVYRRYDEPGDSSSDVGFRCAVPAGIVNN